MVQIREAKTKPQNHRCFTEDTFWKILKNTRGNTSKWIVFFNKFSAPGLQFYWKRTEVKDVPILNPDFFFFLGDILRTIFINKLERIKCLKYDHVDEHCLQRSCNLIQLFMSYINPRLLFILLLKFVVLTQSCGYKNDLHFQTF